MKALAFLLLFTTAAAASQTGDAGELTVQTWKMGLEAMRSYGCRPSPIPGLQLGDSTMTLVYISLDGSSKELAKIDACNVLHWMPDVTLDDLKAVIQAHQFTMQALMEMQYQEQKAIMNFLDEQKSILNELKQ